MARPNGRGATSIVWINYAFIAIVAFFVGVTAVPAALVGAALSGLYSLYLFRGGRVVIWIRPGSSPPAAERANAIRTRRLRGRDLDDYRG